MPTHRRRLALVAAALALAAPPAPAGAAVVDVPPVTVHTLTHEFTGSSARDVIFIPGAGYTSSGFTAAFGTGDVVRVRIQPPAGKKFQLRAPVRAPGAGAAAAGTGSFNVNVYWPCVAGSISHFNPAEVTFENFRGIPPAPTYSLAAANDVIVEAWFDYVTNGDFEFSAFVVDITVDQPLARVPRVFADVGSWASPSFGASSPTTSASFKALEIVDDFTVASTPATWGRIKSLYR